MKLQLSFACLLAAYLISDLPVASAETPKSPLVDTATGSATALTGSEVASERLPENWSDGDVFGLRAFAEPLVAEPIAASAEENAAFFAAVNAFLLSGKPESLEGFLREWPGSRWAAALAHNLGLIKYTAGFFTAAKESWKRSWELARGSKDPRMRALAPSVGRGTGQDAGATGQDRRIEAALAGSQQAGGGRIGPPDA